MNRDDPAERRRTRNRILVAAGAALLVAALIFMPAPGRAGPGAPWWTWIILLFLLTTATGVVSVLSGVGGGVIFVPLVSAFFPFHFDFVRCTGLLVALANSLSATPRLVRYGLAHLNLVLPLALIASVSSLFGAWLGLRMPEKTAMLVLGILILGVVCLMVFSKPVPRRTSPPGKKESLAQKIGWVGKATDPRTGAEEIWQARRPVAGMIVFLFIGLTTGMFGLGAGWANVPTLHLLAGVPLKTAVGTSTTLLGVTTPPAALVYIGRGALLPIIAAPAIIGMATGAKIGALLLRKANPQVVRRLVIAVMILSALRLITRGIR